MSELKRLLNEWADDFELAARKMPTRLEGTILMTRAQECREQAARAEGEPSGWVPVITGKPDYDCFTTNPQRVQFWRTHCPEWSALPLYAHPPAKVPEGWRLVPIEPTESMMRDAADNLCGEFGVEYVRPKEQFARAVYHELVGLAPTPPQEQ